MNTAIVVFLISALAGTGIVLLRAEFRNALWNIEQLQKDFNRQYPCEDEDRL